jgi:O-antigen/teichoic acid export membrane protein
LLIKIFSQIRDPLFINSLYIILTSITGAGFGFIFWIVAAKLYLPSDVGIATALFSSISLLVLLSQLGLDQSLIRFFPEKNKAEIFYTSLIITTLITIFLGLIFTVGIGIWSPDLVIIYQIIPFYFLILASFAIFIIIGSTFIALKHADYVLLQNMFIGIRIIFLFPLIFLGAIGIFYSIGISFILALIIPIFFVYRFKLKFSGINFDYLKESLHFSIGNYLVNIFSLIPILLLPIVVLNLGGSQTAAVYYITYSIAALLFIIPTAFGTMLFVDGSHGQLSKENVTKAFFGIFLFLIPVVIIILIFGKNILDLIGSSYSEGYGLLSVILFSSLGMVIFQLFSAIKKTQKRIKSIIVISTFNCILLIGLSNFLFSTFGIMGVGYAWVISYSLTGIILIPYFYEEFKNLN